MNSFPISVFSFPISLAATASDPHRGIYICLWAAIVALIILVLILHNLRP